MNLYFVNNYFLMSLQNREEYYSQLLNENNTSNYLYIYKCVLEALKNPLDTSYYPGINEIRDTIGMARCWGHAKKFLTMTDNPNVEKDRLLMVLTQLKNSLLEVLPAFVEWYPQASFAINQKVLDFLMGRGNDYRKVNNPKFYAYDIAVENLAKANFQITAENCRYFKGVGPNISAHIKNFLEK